MDRKKIPDKIRSFLKETAFGKKYRKTTAFGIATILLFVGCVFYTQKRDSGWEPALTEENIYPTAAVVENTVGSSTAGDGQSAGDGADSGEDGSDGVAVGESESSDGESGGNTGGSDGDAAGNSEDSDGKNGGNTGDFDGESAVISEGSDGDAAGNPGETDSKTDESYDGTLSGENALAFDVTLKTTEEISDSVPRITFINEDFEAIADAELPYYIRVNTALNCVTVYGLDENGEYSIPVRAMVCSTAKEGKTTPTGTFAISNRAAWMLMVDGTYAQYATRFNGKILFHAVPCNSQSKSDLETEEFNKLGEVASLGCVRLCVADARWIYENCPEGTGVEVYEDETSPGPLGKPVMITIPEDSEYAGWDPTDPDEDNPWNSVKPSIQITDSLKAAAGTTLTEEMLFEGVTATDTCGNDITEYVGITNIHFINAGYDMWQVQYYVVDSLGKTAYMYRIITLE